MMRECAENVVDRMWINPCQHLDPPCQHLLWSAVDAALVLCCAVLCLLLLMLSSSGLSDDAENEQELQEDEYEEALGEE